jgi:protocatechuate 3,4-dioxygenase beta subunit
MVEQAHLVVAIDTSNAVFVSRDDGRHWKAIHVQWQGRAVRTALVEFPVVSRIGFGHDKEARAVALQGAAAESAGNRNEAALAQVRSLSVLPSASLAGTVTDMSGAVIPGATVAVTDTAANAVHTARTDQSGQYHVDGLAPGTYRVDARSPGFRTETLAVVTVAAYRQNVANLSLAVGAAAQTITVTTVPPSETKTLDASAREIPVSKKEKAKPAAPSPPTPVFEIFTDNGERWTSADGVTWKHM